MGNGIAAAAAAAAGAGVALFFGKSLPPVVPLFYSRPWGEEQLVNPWGLAWPVGLAVAGAIVSLLAARGLKNEPVLGAVLLASGIMIEVILILGMLRSVMLVV